MQRREMFVGIIGLLVTPAIVRTSSLMGLPRRPLIRPDRPRVVVPPLTVLLPITPAEWEWAAIPAIQLRDAIDQAVLGNLRSLDRFATLGG